MKRYRCFSKLQLMAALKLYFKPDSQRNSARSTQGQRVCRVVFMGFGNYSWGKRRNVTPPGICNCLQGVAKPLDVTNFTAVLCNLATII